jgi:hypothetical protein
MLQIAPLWMWLALVVLSPVSGWALVSLIREGRHVD